MKDLVVRVTEDHPTRTHNLFWLAEKAGIDIDEGFDKIISILQIYQLEGRYPENFPSEPEAVIARQYFEETEKLYSWLKQKL